MPRPRKMPGGRRTTSGQRKQTFLPFLLDTPLSTPVFPSKTDQLMEVLRVEYERWPESDRSNFFATLKKFIKDEEVRIQNRQKAHEHNQLHVGD